MKEINFSQFKLMKVAPKRTTVLAFTVMLDETMRINGKLKENLKSNSINIWSGPDGTVVLLGEVSADKSEACRIAKDGKARVAELMETLKALNIKLPAKFIVEWNEKEKKWQGELDTNYSVQMRMPSNGKLTPKKQKVKGAGL